MDIVYYWEMGDWTLYMIPPGNPFEWTYQKIDDGLLSWEFKESMPFVIGRQDGSYMKLKFDLNHCVVKDYLNAKYVRIVDGQSVELSTVFILKHNNEIFGNIGQIEIERVRFVGAVDIKPQKKHSIGEDSYELEITALDMFQVICEKIKMESLNPTTSSYPGIFCQDELDGLYNIRNGFVSGGAAAGALGGGASSMTSIKITTFTDLYIEISGRFANLLKAYLRNVNASASIEFPLDAVQFYTTRDSNGTIIRDKTIGTNATYIIYKIIYDSGSSEVELGGAFSNRQKKSIQSDFQTLWDYLKSETEQYGVQYTWLIVMGNNTILYNGVSQPLPTQTSEENIDITSYILKSKYDFSENEYNLKSATLHLSEVNQGQNNSLCIISDTSNNDTFEAKCTFAPYFIVPDNRSEHDGVISYSYNQLYMRRLYWFDHTNNVLKPIFPVVNNYAVDTDVDLFLGAYYNSGVISIAHPDSIEKTKEMVELSNATMTPLSLQLTIMSYIKEGHAVVEVDMSGCPYLQLGRAVTVDWTQLNPSIGFNHSCLLLELKTSLSVDENRNYKEEVKAKLFVRSDKWA